MMLWNRIAFVNGIDIRFGETWYGLHYHWQSIPLFSFICGHRKCNTVHSYGVIIFGLWLYLRIDQ